MRFPRATLVVAGLTFVALGLGFLVDPRGMGSFASLRLIQSSLVEIRAVNGGLELGLGIFFLVANARQRWIRAGLGGVILGCAGLAFGRAAGMLIEGRYDQVHVGFLALELVGVAIAFAAFFRAGAVYDASRIDRRRME